jgi:hypothetical protein
MVRNPNQKEFDLSLQQVQVWTDGRSLHEAITQVGLEQLKGLT